jgi:aminoglycoside phosphotransferase (APT) family kinase protein
MAADPPGIDLLVQHQDRAVVRVGDTYVKIERDTDKAAREHAALGCVPVPVPEVLWFQPGPPAVLALRHVEGRPITADAPPSEWRLAGETVRALHRAPRPDGLHDVGWHGTADLDWIIDDDARWVTDRGLIDPGLVRRVADLASRGLADLAVDPVHAHYDLQSTHVLMRDGKVAAVIDWGDVDLGDPWYDVATLTSRAKHRLGDLAVGYGPVDGDVVRSWWAQRHLGEVRWMVEHAMDPAEPIRLLTELLG